MDPMLFSNDTFSTIVVPSPRSDLIGIWSNSIKVENILNIYYIVHSIYINIYLWSQANKYKIQIDKWWINTKTNANINVSEARALIKISLFHIYFDTKLTGPIRHNAAFHCYFITGDDYYERDWMSALARYGGHATQRGCSAIQRCNT